MTDAKAWYAERDKKTEHVEALDAAIVEAGPFDKLIQADFDALEDARWQLQLHLESNALYADYDSFDEWIADGNANDDEE